MAQPPRHRPHLVEEAEHRSGASTVDRFSLGEQPEVGVDLLGGAVGKAPVVGAVLAETALTWPAPATTQLLMNDPEAIMPVATVASFAAPATVAVTTHDSGGAYSPGRYQQTTLGSVISCSENLIPSRPSPDPLIPPKGMESSR
jgi:hypothetical protein